MTWTIEISLIDFIWRYVAGICAITAFIIILRDQRKTRKWCKEHGLIPKESEGEE